MSDKFSKSSLRFKQEITVSEPEIRYLAKATSPEIIFAVDIPFPLLKDWHRILVSLLDKQTLTSNENLSTGSGDEQASSGSLRLKEDEKSILWISWSILSLVDYLLLQMIKL